MRVWMDLEGDHITRRRQVLWQDDAPFELGPRIDALGLFLGQLSVVLVTIWVEAIKLHWPDVCCDGTHSAVDVIFARPARH